MKRVALPTPWLLEPAKRPDDRADYCLGCRGWGRNEAKKRFRCSHFIFFEIANKDPTDRRTRAILYNKVMIETGELWVWDAMIDTEQN